MVVLGRGNGKRLATELSPRRWPRRWGYPGEGMIVQDPPAVKARG
jgi:hypothetical protein